MKKAFLLVLFGLISSFTSFSQSIDTVFVRNSNAGGSNMEVVAKVWLQNQGRHINIISRTSNDTIYLTSCYFEGALTSPQLVTDTFQLGSLNPGIHTLHFKALKTHDPTHQNHSQCFANWPNIAIINFKVAGTSGIKTSAINPSPEFYPNPVTDILTVESCPLKQISLYDLSGKQVHKELYRGEISARIDVSSMPKGLYFLEVINRDGIISRKRLLKN